MAHASTSTEVVKVVDAETGAQMQIPFNDSTSIMAMKTQIFNITGLQPSEQRLVTPSGSHIRAVALGEQKSAKDYGIKAGDVLELSRLLTMTSGSSIIAGAPLDKFGNAAGATFDLGEDNAFKGLGIGVIHLYTGEGFDFKAPQAALEEKGFCVTRWTSVPSVGELKLFLARDTTTQLWIISDSRCHLCADHIDAIKRFFQLGGGVYIWGDNDPFYADANAVGAALLGVTMTGDDHGDKVVTPRNKGDGPGFTQDHHITPGVEHMYEGVTIARIQLGADTGVTPLVTSSHGHTVTAIYERDNRRALVDGGFTRLFNKWDTAATARFVKNAAVWLSNYDTAAMATQRQYTIDTTPYTKVNWDACQLRKGVRITHVLPNSVDELMDILDAKKPLEELTKPEVLKVAPQPFDDGGATRLPYYACNPNWMADGQTLQPFVAKRSRWTGDEWDTLYAYKAGNDVQSVAACLANQFNKISSDQVPKLHYTMVKTFSGKVCDAAGNPLANTRNDFFNYEPLIVGGQLVKFNGNNGFVNQSAYNDAVHAFSHWTWHATDGKLMVIDVQGLYDTTRQQYTLFDPAIHSGTWPKRFSQTNLKEHGVAKFFLSHRCNQVCRALCLRRHPLQDAVASGQLKEVLEKGEWKSEIRSMQAGPRTTIAKGSARNRPESSTRGAISPPEGSGNPGPRRGGARGNTGGGAAPPGDSGAQSAAAASDAPTGGSTAGRLNSARPPHPGNHKGPGQKGPKKENAQGRESKPQGKRHDKPQGKK